MTLLPILVSVLASVLDRGVVFTGPEAVIAFGERDTARTRDNACIGSHVCRYTTLLLNSGSLGSFPGDYINRLDDVYVGKRWSLSMDRKWWLWLEAATLIDSSIVQDPRMTPSGMTAGYVYKWRYASVDTTKSWVKWGDTVRSDPDGTRRVALVTSVGSMRFDSIAPARSGSANFASVAVVDDSGRRFDPAVSYPAGRNLFVDLPIETSPQVAHVWYFFVGGIPCDSFAIGGEKSLSQARRVRRPAKLGVRDIDPMGRRRVGGFIGPIRHR